MLSRYAMKRGARAEDLPQGIRQDTRKHTRHVLRPPAEVVKRYLAAPSDSAWDVFRGAYLAALDERFHKERARFDELAALARSDDVYLGCSCPTKANPDIRHCHTWLALEFMTATYPELDVRFPPLTPNKIGPNW